MFESKLIVSIFALLKLKGKWQRLKEIEYK